MILVRAGDLERHEAGIALASRLMRATFTRRGDILNALRDLYSWTTLLTEAEQQEFATEIENLVWSAADLGEYRGLLEGFQSWKGTAEAYAAGMPRTSDDLTWLPDLPVVPRPE